MRRAERYTESAIRRHHGAAQQTAIGCAHLNGRAGFTGAGELRAIGTHAEIGGGGRRSGVRRGDRARCGHIACTVNQRHIEGLAVVLRSVQVNLELPVGTDGARAQQIAGRIAHLHDAAGLAESSQRAAIGRQAQTGRSRGWRRIAIATTAASASTARSRRRTASTQQAQPGDRPCGGGAINHADTGDQLVERAYFVEGKAIERFRVVARLPQGGVITLEHDVVGNTIRAGDKEIGDFDLLARLQIQDQILTAATGRRQLFGPGRNLYN